ncbi:MAG TPA: outer membrane beta-barrel protein [Puia sp.]|nr:outer membrane beta-barrel protein [Puia sp.]
MYRILLLALFSLLVAHEGRGQAAPGLIDGIVRDSVSGSVLEEATIDLHRLKHDTAGKLFAVRRNGQRGFAFHGLPAGRYVLVATYLGYQPDTIGINVPPGGISHVLLRMQRSDQSMMQVVVTARIPPVIVRNDTIAFNAGAYPTQPNATLEDLLRKLPGIDIDKNGNVTMQGKKVDKIYLDGKEFFLGDPRTATQNLPADIIDQVEAFDSQSDHARLTGIKDVSGTKSINIRLKKNRRKGFFGKLYAGAGTGAPAGEAAGSGSMGPAGGGHDPGTTPGSYSVGGNAMVLGETRLFGDATVNNINNQFTGKDNRNGPGNAGTQTLNNLDLNLRHETKRLSYTVNGGTNGSRTVLDQQNTTQTTLTDSSLLSDRKRSSVSTRQNWFGNAFIEYNPDSLRLLELRSTWSGNSASSNATDSTHVSALKLSNNYPVNGGQTMNSSRSNEWQVSNQLNFRRRWRKPGQILLVGVTQSSSRQRQPQTTYSLVDNYDSSGHLSGRTKIDQEIGQTSANDAYGVQLTYTHPVSKGHLLDWTYRLDRTVSRSDRSSHDFDSATGSYDLPDAVTSNHFTTTNTIQRAGMGYNVVSGRVQYQLGLAAQVSELDNLNRSTDSTLKLRQTNWYPRASLIYTPVRGRSVNLQYGASTTSPTLQQLQPVADPTNPFFIRVGNPGLEQELTHHVSAAYNAFEPHHFRNWQLGLDGTYSEHAIVAATTILAGGIQQQRFVNVNGVWNASTHLSYGFPLGDQRKGNGSISLGGQYGRGANIVNGIENRVSSPGGSATGKLNFHPVADLFIEANGSLAVAANRNSVNPSQNTVGWTQRYSLQASYTLPWALTVSTFYTLQLVSGTLPAPPVSLWNASAWKEIGRRRRVQLRLSAFGLLNNTKNSSQSVGVGTLSTTETNIPGRVLLLSVIWHFRKFS